MEAAGGGSIVTMTYLGGERAVPHYNVMGVAKATLDSSVRYLAWDLGQKNIRVNAVSAGPVRTLAARSIAGFPTMEAIVEERAPLHRHIDADDVAGAAAYLLGDDATQRHRHHAVRRQRVPRDGHVAAAPRSANPSRNAAEPDLGRLRQVAHDLDDVAVRVPDPQLAVGAVAAREDLEDPLELALAAELARVRLDVA